MDIKDKTFRALQNFTIGKNTYAKGDVVPRGRQLAQLIDMGGFVHADDSPQMKSATAPTTKKEGSDNG